MTNAELEDIEAALRRGAAVDVDTQAEAATISAIAAADREGLIDVAVATVDPRSATSSWRRHPRVSCAWRSTPSRCSTTSPSASHLVWWKRPSVSTRFAVSSTSTSRGGAGVRPRDRLVAHGRVPAQRARGDGAHPERTRHQLRRVGGAGRQAERGPCRRQRGRVQPGGDRRSLPPCGPRERRRQQVRRRTRSARPSCSSWSTPKRVRRDAGSLRGRVDPIGALVGAREAPHARRA